MFMIVNTRLRELDVYYRRRYTLGDELLWMITLRHLERSIELGNEAEMISCFDRESSYQSAGTRARMQSLLELIIRCQVITNRFARPLSPDFGDGHPLFSSDAREPLQLRRRPSS